MANGVEDVAVRRGEDAIVVSSLSPELPKDLLGLIKAGEPAFEHLSGLLRAGKGAAIDQSTVTYLPLLPHPPKIICVGLNNPEHAAEVKMEVPDFPLLFTRFASTLVGHEQPILKPLVSDRLDYESEMVAIIGRKAHYVPKETALEHVAGYSVFNEASIRDYQFRTSQFTIGKNFDGTGAFGPDFVTADELPPGARGLAITARLNGRTMQSATVSDFIFDVATLVSMISEVMTLFPGDVIVTGTGGGVGFTRMPPIFMKHGDVCECEVEGVGLLRNPIRNEV